MRADIGKTEPLHRGQTALTLIGARFGIRSDRHFRILILPHVLFVEPHFGSGF